MIYGSMILVGFGLHLTITQKIRTNLGITSKGYSYWQYYEHIISLLETSAINVCSSFTIVSAALSVWFIIKIYCISSHDVIGMHLIV